MKKIISIILAMVCMVGLSVSVFAEEETSQLPLNENYVNVYLYDRADEPVADGEEKETFTLVFTFNKPVDGQDNITTQSVEVTTNKDQNFKLNVSPAWITSIKIVSETELTLEDLWICSISYNAFPHRIYTLANEALISSNFYDYMEYTIPVGETELISEATGFVWHERITEPRVVTYMTMEYDVIEPLKDSSLTVEVSAKLGNNGRGYYLGTTDEDNNVKATKFVEQGHESFTGIIDSYYNYSFEDLKKIQIIVDKENLGLKVENLKIEVYTMLTTFDYVKYGINSFLLGKSEYTQDELTFDSQYFEVTGKQFKTTVELNEYYARYIKDGIAYVGSIFGEGIFWILTGIGGIIIGFFVGLFVNRKKAEPKKQA